MPGYIVSPNVPFQINASSGTRIYFYYTYSFPGAGERNNAANKDEYIVGSCQNIGIQENDLLMIKAYPNPVSQYLHIEWVGNIAQMQVYQLNGVLVESMEVAGTSIRYDMSSLPKGLYFFKMVIDNQIEVFKVLKD
jgi:hypothetical protein